MIDNIKKMDYIRSQLAWIRSKVELDNQLGLYDINKLGEDIFMHILSLVPTPSSVGTHTRVTTIKPQSLHITRNEELRHKYKVPISTILSSLLNIVMFPNMPKYHNFIYKLKQNSIIRVNSNLM